jgi:hypothetical protein
MEKSHVALCIKYVLNYLVNKAILFSFKDINPRKIMIVV